MLGTLKHNCWYMRLPASHPYHLPPSPDLTPTLLTLLTPPPQPDPSPLTPLPRLPSKTPRPLDTPDHFPSLLGPIQALLHGNSTKGTTLWHNMAADALLAEELPTWVQGELLSLEDWRWCLNLALTPIPSPISHPSSSSLHNPTPFQL